MKTLSIKSKGEISSQDIPHIFTPFFRSDSSKSSDGKGLGLAITKSFVEANGGTITAENENGQVVFKIKI